MALAEVHTLYRSNCRNIPQMLREAADNIETEADEGYSPTKAMIAVQLTEAGAVQVYGWGDTDMIQALGLLHLGLQEIGSIQLIASEE
jgi:L-asparaginase II